MNLDPLQKYLPENALNFLYSWLSGVSLKIHVKSKRKTKLGDYRFDPEKSIHHITIDGTLEPYPFFFVMTHEIAHLIVRKNYPKGVKSHGDEWKITFGKLLTESIGTYPETLRPLIHRHALNPKASVGADPKLHKKLFLTAAQSEMLVENLKEGQYFRIGKRIFEKGQKRKIRYICRELKTNRSFLVSGQAVVEEIIDK